METVLVRSLKAIARKRDPQVQAEKPGKTTVAKTVLLLEKLSELLGQPLQIGRGGLREGILLELVEGRRLA